MTQDYYEACTCYILPWKQKGHVRICIAHVRLEGNLPFLVCMIASSLVHAPTHVQLEKVEVYISQQQALCKFGYILYGSMLPVHVGRGIIEICTQWSREGIVLSLIYS